VPLAHKARLAQRVQLVLLVLPDRKGRRDQPGRRETWGRQERRELRVRLAQLVLAVQMERLGRKDKQALRVPQVQPDLPESQALRAWRDQLARQVRPEQLERRVRREP